MTRLANNFEGGTNGVTLTSGSGGNTGGASGDYFDHVAVPSDGILVFDNAQKAAGSLSLKLATRATSGGVYARYESARRGQIADDYIRFYFWTDDKSTGGIARDIISWYAGVTKLGSIAFGNNRLYVADQSASYLSANSTNLLAAGQWVRIEAHLHPRTDGTGSIEVRLYLTPSSTGTPDWDYTLSGLTQAQAYTDLIYMGNTAPGANWPTSTGVIRLDEIVTGETTWPGPVATGGQLSVAIAGTSSLTATITSAGHTYNRFSVAIQGRGTLRATFRRLLDVAIQGRGSIAAAFVPATYVPSGLDALDLQAGGRILLEDGYSDLLREFQGGPVVVSNLAPITTYAVEVSWGQSWQTGGLFTFGSSTLGGPDTFAASSFSGSFNVPYGDLSALTRTISIVRGRDDLLGNMNAGTLTLNLVDPTGLLNIRNPSSPLAGALYTGVPIRVSAWTSDGTKWPIYYGFISTLTSDPAGRYGTAEITAVDLFERLQREKPNLGPLNGQTTGSLIQNLLAAIGWIDPAMIDLGVGDVLFDPYLRADGTNDVLSLIEEALLAERGYFYIAGNGAATYLSRYQVLTEPSSTTIDRRMTGAPSTLDSSRIVNRWTVSRNDMAGNPIGQPQLAAVDPTDDVSYRRYHYIDGSLTSPLLVSDNQALALAQYLLALTRNPVGVGWQVPINPSDSATLDQVILRDLGDRVTLTVDPIEWPAYTADYTIQQIKHEITTDPLAPRHVTTWGLAEAATGNPFQFGSSVFGGTDVLVY